MLKLHEDLFLTNGVPFSPFLLLVFAFMHYTQDFDSNQRRKKGKAQQLFKELYHTKSERQLH